jgi:hypothetical protein
MDVRMRVRDGPSASKAIIREFGDGKIVAITTYGGDETFTARAPQAPVTIH